MVISQLAQSRCRQYQQRFTRFKMAVKFSYNVNELDFVVKRTAWPQSLPKPSVAYWPDWVLQSATIGAPRQSFLRIAPFIFPFRMIEILAVLSASAAGGMRIALPLLLIGLLYGEQLWSDIPLLSAIAPPVILWLLITWSLAELIFSKDLLGRRFMQLVQLLFSPIVGTIMGLTVAHIIGLSAWLTALLAVIGGLLALVLQLVQVGWSFRVRHVPFWVAFVQDGLCILLVLLALDAPRQGGLIALLLLWLAIRSSKEWRQWYLAQAVGGDRRRPRRFKRDPD